MFKTIEDARKAFFDIISSPVPVDEFRASLSGGRVVLLTHSPRALANTPSAGALLTFRCVKYKNFLEFIQ